MNREECKNMQKVKVKENEKSDSIQISLFDYFLDDDNFTLKEATRLVKEQRKMNVNDESIRARIYEGIDRGIFKRVARGVYKVEKQIDEKTVTCLLINGDGRDLSYIKDNSIDGIVTDHPYDLTKSLKGGNRKFAKYELFRYKSRDFKEKNRVLKDGAFCVEFLPEENESNYQYLYEVKQMALENGFKYFAKVPWEKGSFVSNTGRKSHNIEDVMIFSKGEPRCLKPDAKKNKKLAQKNDIDAEGLNSQQLKDVLKQHGLDVFYMKGTTGMLPTAFNFQPKRSSEKIMEAEKPVGLLESIIEYISLPDELLLDQFGGSGNFAIACSKLGRNSIVIEKDINGFSKMKKNIVDNLNTTNGKVVS